MLKKVGIFFQKTYVYLLLLAIYIPLFVGAIYSFSKAPKKGNMSHVFSYSGEGWSQLWNDQNIAIRILASLVIALIVASIVVALSLMTVYSLWKSKSKTAKGFVAVTHQIPLINPDVITGIALMIAFGAMFGILQRGQTGLGRVIVAQSVMIMPFGIAIMYPRSEKFAVSIMEASKDLGYGPIATWFKTYFRHMLSMMIATFLVAMTLSFDDFIITKTVSKVQTIGTKMYAETLRPWVLALGTIMMATVLSATFILGIVLKFTKRGKK